MFQCENKQINSTETIKKSIGTKTVPYSDSVGVDTITFLNNTIKIKKNNTTLRGGINIVFKDVKKGDVIEFSAYFKNISGAIGRVSVYEMPNIYLDSSFVLIDYILTDENVSGYQLVKNKYLATKDYPNIAISFGVWTEDVCELDIKNAKATLCRQSFKKEYSIKPYCIEKKETGWIIREDMSCGDGVLTIQNANTLRITYNIPFNSRPIMGTVNTPFAGAQKYELLNLYNQQDYIDFQIVDRNTNVVVDLSVIPNGSSFHLSLIGE